MTFKQHRDADWRMASARQIIRLLLDANELYPSYRRQFIKLALWKVTEAEGAGKYKTRFRSIGSLEASVNLHHEHVYERATMADELIANPDDMDKILDLAVGCVVTVDEHKRLAEIKKRNPNLTGWSRYSEAGIRVIDTSTGQEWDLTGR